MWHGHGHKIETTCYADIANTKYISQNNASIIKIIILLYIIYLH